MSNSKLTRAVRHSLAVAAIVAGTGATAVAWAADAAEGLEEIVVTAQKREQNIKDVPVSVSVVSAEQILESGATTFADLIQSLPGISGFTTGVATSVWAIRGLSSNTSGSGGEPSVGYYQDEAFASYVEWAAMPIFDSNRIEVAKGPQGTLFGKNATAGAILVYTNRPSTDGLGGYVRLGGGNYGQQRAEGAINVPLGDRFAVRLSGMYENLDDWQKNMLIDGSEGGSMERYAGRLGASWQVTDSFDAYAFVQYYKGESNQWLTTNQKITGDKNPRHVYSVIPESTDEIETQGAHLELNWKFSDRLAFKSITDYREMPEYVWQADAIAAPQNVILAATTAAFRLPINSVLAVQGPLRDQGKKFSTDMFQQELRASYDGDRFFVQGGVNYVTYSETRPMQAAVLNLDRAGFRLLQSTGWESTRDSYGVFVDGSFDLTPKWTLTAGVRYSKDDSEFTALADAYRYLLPAPGNIGTYSQDYYNYTAGLTNAPFCAFSLTSPAVPCTDGVTDDRSDDSWTPRLAATYKLTDNTNVYASYARGFKAGGFDVVLTNPNSVNQFDPETVDAFEIGFKGQVERARYAAAVFFNKYDDLQVSAIVNAVSRTANAASAEAKGWEGELTWLLTENLELSGNYTYTNAEYTDGILALGGAPVPAAGKRLIRTPENVFNLQLNWSIPVGFGTVSIVPIYHYQSEMELNFANRPDLRQPAYTKVDGRITFTSSGGNWDVSLIGENMTGEKIIARAADLVSFGPQIAYQPDELYRLEVGYRFGKN